MTQCRLKYVHPNHITPIPHHPQRRTLAMARGQDAVGLLYKGHYEDLKVRLYKEELSTEWLNYTVDVSLWDKNKFPY